MFALVVFTLIELFIMIVINDVFFANVIQMGIYTILLPTGLLFGIIALIRGPTTGTLVRNVFYMLTPIILFVVALPHYNYQQGKVMVVKRFNEQPVQFGTVRSRTVPVTPGYSWLLYHREYYYRAQLKRSSKVIYCTVNPVTGQVLSNSKDYWTSH